VGGWTFTPSQQNRLTPTAPDEASVVLGPNSSAIYGGAAIGGAVGGLVLPAGTVLVPAIATGLAACALICVAAQRAASSVWEENRRREVTGESQ
jgi:DHA1 family inner membrane transport protein